MKTTGLYICGVLSFLWILSESLAFPHFENDTHNTFTIDANPYAETKLLVPSASDNIENRGNYNENYKHYTTSEKPQNNKEHAVQASVKVASENHKKKGLNDLEKKEEKLNQHSKKQSWQIPISPLSTSDPKETNSSKRQIEPTEGGFINQFVPSQELGPIEEGGFLPQHYIPPPAPYPTGKAETEDASEEYRIGLLTHRGMVAFQNDFGSLRSKYPELDELMNDYPVLEEVMKRKLVERFRYSSKNKLYGITSNSGDNSEEKGNDQIKIPSTESSGEKFTVHPYLFEYPKPIKDGKKQQQMWDLDLQTTVETPFAGEFYQAHRLPITSYVNQSDEDKKNITFEEHYKHPVYIETKPHKTFSPWKKVAHMLTAFLPLGLLISALTPNVITINSTTDRPYLQGYTDRPFPYRQRSLATDDNPHRMTNPLVDFMNGQYEESERRFGGDVACDDRAFCEMSRRGQHADAGAMEKILWTLANSTPDNIAEKAGMKKLFKTVKSGKCEQFICKKTQFTNIELRTDDQERPEDQQQPPRRRRKSRVVE